MVRKRISLIVFCFLSIACFQNGNKSSHQPDKAYKVIGITDGDTFDLLMDNKPVRIRMDAIDAPEKGMPYYNVAKAYLSQLCFGKFVTIQSGKTDRHGRLIARAFTEDGKDLSLEMVKAGLAWHYTEYSDDKTLADAESAARQHKIGLWKDKVQAAPWEVRAYRRAGNRVEFTGDSIRIVRNVRD